MILTAAIRADIYLDGVPEAALPVAAPISEAVTTGYYPRDGRADYEFIRDLFEANLPAEYEARMATLTALRSDRLGPLWAWALTLYGCRVPVLVSEELTLMLLPADAPFAAHELRQIHPSLG